MRIPQIMEYQKSSERNIYKISDSLPKVYSGHPGVENTRRPQSCTSQPGAQRDIFLTIAIFLCLESKICLSASTLVVASLPHPLIILHIHHRKLSKMQIREEIVVLAVWILCQVCQGPLCSPASSSLKYILEPSQNNLLVQRISCLFNPHFAFACVLSSAHLSALIKSCFSMY